MENKITLIGDVASAPRESHKSMVRIFINFLSELKEEVVLQIYFRYCLTKKSAIQKLAERYVSRER